MNSYRGSLNINTHSPFMLSRTVKSSGNPFSHKRLNFAKHKSMN